MEELIDESMEGVFLVLGSVVKLFNTVDHDIIRLNLQDVALLRTIAPHDAIHYIHTILPKLCFEKSPLTRLCLQFCLYRFEI